MGEKKNIHKFLWYGNMKERVHLEDIDVDGRIVLKWILRKWDGMTST